MTARVVPYAVDPEDIDMSLMIVCYDCANEWGWCRDSRENDTKLQGLADKHNKEFHNEQ